MDFHAIPPRSLTDSDRRLLVDIDIPLDPEPASTSRGRFPAPLTGHELMSLFTPPSPPMRLGTTSDYFRLEERKFFARAVKKSYGCASKSTHLVMSSRSVSPRVRFPNRTCHMHNGSHIRTSIRILSRLHIVASTRADPPSRHHRSRSLSRPLGRRGLAQSRRASTYQCPPWCLHHRTRKVLSNLGTLGARAQPDYPVHIPLPISGRPPKHERGSIGGGAGEGEGDNSRLHPTPHNVW